MRLSSCSPYEDLSQCPDLPEPLAAVITDALNLVSLVDLAHLEAGADAIGSASPPAPMTAARGAHQARLPIGKQRRDPCQIASGATRVSAWEDRLRYFVAGGRFLHC